MCDCPKSGIFNPSIGPKLSTPLRWREVPFTPFWNCSAHRLPNMLWPLYTEKTSGSLWDATLNSKEQIMFTAEYYTVNNVNRWNNTYISGTYPDKQSFGPLPTKKASSSNIFATRSSTMELPEYMAPSWLCRSLSWPLWNLKYKWRLQSKTDEVISQSGHMCLYYKDNLLYSCK